MSTPEPQTPGFTQTNGLVPEFSPIIVHIAYSLRNPVDGFEFVVPSDAYPFVSRLLRIIHLFLDSVSKACTSCIYLSHLPGLREMLGSLLG